MNTWHIEGREKCGIIKKDDKYLPSFSFSLSFQELQYRFQHKCKRELFGFDAVFG